MNKLHKTATLTDIHFGRKSNSDVHNSDCVNFIKWFCDQVRKDPEIDNIVFMGDWHENRNALNISTLTYSYQGAKLLNELGLPVYFCIGNHDLYHRHTRELYSVVPFHEFANFIVVNEPIVVPEMGDGALISPFLFHDEYPSLVEHLNLQSWFGHFEFKGFVVTGYTITMPTGPDPVDYSGPDIFSGHFHKRQSNKNIHYTGNCFPMDFSDAGQIDRGMCIYSHDTRLHSYIDWAECPKYSKFKLSDLLEDTSKIHADSRVKCIVDVPISYEESAFLRQTFMEDFQLREFSMEESQDLYDALTGTELVQVDVEQEEDENGDIKLASVDDLVVLMINSIDTPHIENTLLTQIYQQLRL